jgi:ribosomal protein L40E
MLAAVTSNARRLGPYISPTKISSRPMALKECRECGSRLSTRAATCPSCGAPNKKKPFISGCGCLLLILVFGVIFSIVRSPGPIARAPTPATGSDIDARVMVWQFIESEMAPIVVDHDFGVEVKYNEGSKSWVASGSFTTHNGTIRKKYKMTLSTTDGKKWRVEELLWL